ncbi:formyltetrahydrofolate deformylase [Sphingomonas jinjuensis]|uniref:Formyltetrahydrofolate deformylase n=1 Tax=Sphingomonas jinjuensis TaxID=535907 RepID=A0A840FDH7_9SPHN|nr:formyltetrahydrofolate deformylase [Sphingomonas jinjuensis]
MTTSQHILTLSCEDRVGIVAAVSGFLAERGDFIVESQQFADLDTGHFFMRVAFQPGEADLGTTTRDFAPVAKRFGMRWTLTDAAQPMRVVIAVSRFGHCLNDLLHRWRTGTLPVEIVGVVSNHEDFRALSEWHGLAFHHLPVGSDRAAQEQRILDIVADAGAELLVLARYMQVLSPELCAALAGRCINIHHSFLPSFRGAKPYHQAHARGVKLIGATAHFVTPDLDEGPIIEQAIERVDHATAVETMVNTGRDVESIVLARAVTWAAERRIFPNGGKTVVFRR